MGGCGELVVVVHGSETWWVFRGGGWMRKYGELVVMLHGREIVVLQWLWCMVQKMSSEWICCMSIFMVNMGVTELEQTVMFCAPRTLSCAPYMESKGC
jgi:hypothetical protein